MPSVVVAIARHPIGRSWGSHQQPARYIHATAGANETRSARLAGRATHGIRRIALYGSALREDLKPTSDFDLMLR
jgi:hypothetical protein